MGHYARPVGRGERRGGDWAGASASAVWAIGAYDLIPFEFSAGARFDECFEMHEDYETAREIRDIITYERVTDSDITVALRVLSRYLDLCKLAGRDY